MSRNQFVLIGLLLAYVVVILCTLNHPFFWDGLYNARCATYFFEEGTNGLILPEDFDAGHPPLFALYLSSGWKLFGRTLLTSHILYAPVVLSLAVTGFLLFKETIKKEHLGLACLALFLEPTILTQSTVIHQDLLMASLYMLGLYLILSDRKKHLYIPLLILPMLSLRGAVMVAALGLTDLLLTTNKRDVFRLKNLGPYLISGALFIVWGIYHHQQTGWAFFTQSPGYSDSRGFNSLFGMSKNTAVIIRNILDCGRIIIVLASGALMLSKRKELHKYRRELIIFLVPTILLALSFIPFKNPIGHRYFLISYLLLIPVFLKLVADLRMSKLMIGGVLVSFIIGQFIVYPPSVSQGWDSNLSHVPYFELRTELDQFLKDENIPIEEVGANFPLKYSENIRRLKGETSFHSDIDLDANDYLMLSNICNDIKLYPAEKLKADFDLILNKEKRGVFIRLYKRR